MSEPYRDNHLACPACKAPLREFKTRQVCDACNGMMLALEDLAGGRWSAMFKGRSGGWGGW